MVNIPVAIVESDPSVKVLAMLKENNKHTASKENVRHGYSPIGDSSHSLTFNIAGASP